MTGTLRYRMEQNESGRWIIASTASPGDVLVWLASGLQGSGRFRKPITVQMAILLKKH